MIAALGVEVGLNWFPAMPRPDDPRAGGVGAAAVAPTLD